MAKSRVIYPNITPEENEKRLQEVERVLSIILKTKVKLVPKKDKK